MTSSSFLVVFAPVIRSLENETTKTNQPTKSSVKLKNFGFVLVLYFKSVWCSSSKFIEPFHHVPDETKDLTSYKLKLLTSGNLAPRTANDILARSLIIFLHWCCLESERKVVALKLFSLSNFFSVEQLRSVVLTVRIRCVGD